MAHIEEYGNSEEGLCCDEEMQAVGVCSCTDLSAPTTLYVTVLLQCALCNAIRTATRKLQASTWTLDSR